MEEELELAQQTKCLTNWLFFLIGLTHVEWPAFWNQILLRKKIGKENDVEEEEEDMKIINNNKKRKQKTKSLTFLCVNSYEIKFLSFFFIQLFVFFLATFSLCIFSFYICLLYSTRYRGTGFSKTIFSAYVHHFPHSRSYFALSYLFYFMFYSFYRSPPPSSLSNVWLLLSSLHCISSWLSPSCFSLRCFASYSLFSVLFLSDILSHLYLCHFASFFLSLSAILFHSVLLFPSLSLFLLHAHSLTLSLSLSLSVCVCLSPNLICFSLSRPFYFSLS